MVCPFFPQSMCGYPCNNVDRPRLDNVFLGIVRPAGFTSALTDCFSISDVVLTLGAWAVAFRLGSREIAVARIMHNMFRPIHLPIISQQRKNQRRWKGELASYRKKSERGVPTRQRCSQLCVAISRRAVAEDPASHPPARPYRHPYCCFCRDLKSSLSSHSSL